MVSLPYGFVIDLLRLQWSMKTIYTIKTLYTCGGMVCLRGGVYSYWIVVYRFRINVSTPHVFYSVGFLLVGIHPEINPFATKSANMATVWVLIRMFSGDMRIVWFFDMSSLSSKSNKLCIQGLGVEPDCVDVWPASWSGWTQLTVVAAKGLAEKTDKVAAAMVSLPDDDACGMDLFDAPPRLDEPVAKRLKFSPETGEFLGFWDSSSQSL